MTHPAKQTKEDFKRRSSAAVDSSIASSKRTDLALRRLDACLESSSGIPIEDLPEEDSLVIDVTELKKSVVRSRPSRRLAMVKSY